MSWKGPLGYVIKALKEGMAIVNALEKRSVRK